jgi:hypothetical protein
LDFCWSAKQDRGSGFTATLSGTQVINAPTIYVGDDALPGVIWVDTTTLSATVLWGLEPGVYPLTVINPDGISATLQNTFTVTEGLGEFVTGGPYAAWSCSSFAITPSPHTSGRVLVGASLSPPGGGDDVGIFYRSDDYGESWTYVEPPQPITRISEMAYDAFNPNLIYAVTAESGLWRSKTVEITGSRSRLLMCNPPL